MYINHFLTNSFDYGSGCSNVDRVAASDTSGQSCKASTIVIYNSRVLPDLKERGVAIFSDKQCDQIGRILKVLGYKLN